LRIICQPIFMNAVPVESLNTNILSLKSWCSAHYVQEKIRQILINILLRLSVLFQAEQALFYQAMVGPAIIIVNKMSKRTKPPDSTKQKLQQALELLKFVLTLDDEEITKSTIESIIELLEEENQ
jgi:hypothetical protein